MFAHTTAARMIPIDFLTAYSPLKIRVYEDVLKVGD
jgi:hypothetical protein